MSREGDVHERIDQLESLVEEQRERIEEQESKIAEQRETVERQRERIDELESSSADEGSARISRRGALKTGGLLALLAGGAGTASAAPTGQVGTSSRPLDTLYADTLTGPLVNGNTVESLVGGGLDVSGNSLYSAVAQSSRPPVGSAGTLWLIPSVGLNLVDDGGTGALGLSYGADGFLYAGRDFTGFEKIDPSDMTVSVSYDPGNDVFAVEYGRDGNLYAGVGSDVEKYDPTNLSGGPLDSYTGESFPINGLSYGPDGFLYAGSSDNNVLRIDPSNMNLDSSFNVGNSIFAVVYGDDGNLYVGGQTGAVEKYDPTNLSGGPVDSVSVNGDSEAISYGNDGFVYAVEDQNGERALKIDPSNMTISESYNNGNGLFGVSYGDDGFVYVGGDGGDVSKLDPSDMSLVTSYSTSAIESVEYGDDDFVYGGTGSVGVYQLSGRRLSVSTGSEWIQVP